MVTFISNSPEETQRLGEDWGRAAVSGLVIGLSGNLGAGKTQLVKGLARGLGIPARVHSPTFALVNIYEGGRLILFHLDLYRLDTLEQIVSAGLQEYLQPRGVTVIEWAERWFGSTVHSPQSTVHSPQSTVHSPQSKTESPKSKVQSPKSSIPSLRSQVSSLKSQAPTALRGTGSHGPQVLGRVFQVHLETISETVRRITYEDPGA